MGSFSYTLTEEGPGRPLGPLPGGTKATAAAELRGRGLNVIAATLEGAPGPHVCGVVLPDQESNWVPMMDADIVELVKHRYLNGK